MPGRPIGIDEGPPEVPKPGQRDVQPVKLTSLGTRVEGFHVIVIARWTSGVEPCTVLDSVVLKKAAGSIEVTVREGTSDPGAVCNMLAKLKWIGVDVGELNGVWTISDTEGGAKPIEFGGP
ncbi:MAG: hypothetical protein ACJ761_06565 [Chloroflexota bacterium]